MEVDPGELGDCCGGGGDDTCVFAKALLARHAGCGLVQRRALGEREWLGCTSPVARINCATLAALLRERSTFALHLPRPGTPLPHVKVMQVQCGGLTGLQQSLQATERDVHQMVQQAQSDWGSLLDAPWGEIVRCVVAWHPRTRGVPRA
ncbi:hypothetical protein [Ideonella sp.]|uniref:hypothetical protein n=1 Tax=Ideonella sp. TaxID=1929293 RepID=UPI002B479299|nr:hypothetical protein [Ideonella sp.]HJV70572.1 hypothetical protein [Ideonella sp.]